MFLIEELFKFNKIYVCLKKKLVVVKIYIDFLLWRKVIDR